VPFREQASLGSRAQLLILRLDKPIAQEAFRDVCALGIRPKKTTSAARWPIVIVILARQNPGAISINIFRSEYYDSLPEFQSQKYWHTAKAFLD